MLKYRGRNKRTRDLYLYLRKGALEMTSGSSPISEQKAQLRKRISAERSLLPENVRKQKSENICHRAIEYFKLEMNSEMRKDYVLYTYIPFRDELNVMPIVEWCWKSGIRVAAPRVHPFLKELEFRYIKGYEDLQPQPPWGLLEPTANLAIADYQSHPSCMLVPGVAFDLNRARIGYGGGYYDKFLHSMNELNVRIYKIALALDLQIVHEVPCEQHDIAVDAIITETRVI
jgi:5-formyltetrahydrofolate cyclo-ligase